MESAQEFCEMMTGRMTAKDGDSEILKAYRLFVPEEGGKIGLEQLRRVATEVSLSFSWLSSTYSPHKGTACEFLFSCLI